MAVIGLTCRMDAISLFEKRVRSRFSHRQIYLLSKPDFDKYLKHFENLLSLQTTRGLKAIYVKNWNKSIQGLITDPVVIGTLRKLFNFNAKPRYLHNILVNINTKYYEGRLIMCRNYSFPYTFSHNSLLRFRNFVRWTTHSYVPRILSLLTNLKQPIVKRYSFKAFQFWNYNWYVPPP